MALNPNIFGDDFPTDGDSTFGVPACMLELGAAALNLLPGDALAVISMSLNEGILAARSMIADIKAEILEFLGLTQDEKDGQGFFRLDGAWGSMLNALEAISFAIGFINELAGTISELIEDIEYIKNCLSSFESQIKSQRGYSGNIAATEAQVNIYQTQIQAAEQFILDASNMLNGISEVLAGRQSGALLEPSALLLGDVEQEGEIFRLTYGPPKSTKGTFLLSVDGLYYDSQNRTYAASGNVPTIEDLEFVPDASRWKLDHSPNLGGKGTQITLGDLNRYVDTILDPEIVDEADFLQPYYIKDHLLEVLEGQKNLVVSQLDSQRKDILATYGTSSAVYINMQQQIFAEIELFDNKIKKRKKQIELAVKAPDLFGLEILFQPGEVPVNDFSYLSDINLNVALDKQRKLVLDQGDVSGVVLPFKPVFVGNANSQNNIAIAPIEVNKNIVGALADISPYSESTAGVAPVLTLNDPITTDKLVAVYNFLETEVEDTASTTYNVANCTGDSRQDMQIVSQSRSEAFPKGLAIPRFTGVVKFDKSDESFIRRTEHGTYGRLPATEEMQNLFYNPSGCSFDFWLHMPNLASGLNDFEVNVFDNGLDASAEISSMTMNSETAAWTDFNFFKAILANENTGGPEVGDSGSVINDFTTDHTRGLFIGFTRSPMFTVGSPAAGVYPDPAGSLNPVENYESYLTCADTVNDNSKTAFVIAPMQSYSKDGCSFIRKDDCDPDESMYRGMVIPITQATGGKSFASCADEYIHVNISFDFNNDTITVYLDGRALQTDSISSVFGTEKGKPISIPSFKKMGANASFDYPGSIPQQETEDFIEGPRTDPFFTPWIIGGGWTDGFPLKGTASKGNSTIVRDLNQLGTDSKDYLNSPTNPNSGNWTTDLSSVYGGFSGPSNGIYTGLGGHLGSLKIYSKPLSNSEVITNYSAHSNFFKNIEV